MEIKDQYSFQWEQGIYEPQTKWIIFVKWAGAEDIIR